MTMKPIILVTPRSFSDAHLLSDLLEKISFVLNRSGQVIDPRSLIKDAEASRVVAVIAGIEKWDLEMLRHFPNLKLVVRFGSGVENVDLEAAKKFGITVLNTPLGLIESVAEFTLGLALNLSRKISQMHLSVIGGEWSSIQGRLLVGKKVGVIGLGRIGREVAGLFQSIGCSVEGYDPLVENNEPTLTRLGLSRTLELSELLSSVDILTFHVPLTDVTLNLVTESELQLMKNTALIINTARGGVVNESDLTKALVSGQIGGAALDVFAKEPYQGRLASLPNVILTPHAASNTAEAKQQMSQECMHLIRENLVLLESVEMNNV
jgi:D-3-phosphoglycerate dehydrogenase